MLAVLVSCWVCSLSKILPALVQLTKALHYFELWFAFTVLGHLVSSEHDADTTSHLIKGNNCLALLKSCFIFA